ncbi:unnamed protein product [Rotaria sp. Silwood2]|nr:unnamed protein product [Rotaria sp. Silwood2]CAF2835259.1 unnamed protein product [Rotaria sp. Silwood2]CAF3074382.1 unnamed protein product [Rotaria sp. Silwood2]CAF3239541.1 unnamed protein product [Rotaria sp. Silwood2]CAF3978089.1 unnamed protein product [Rotaria sp. Silwood2]
MVGIDAKNKNILDTSYICSVCPLILRNPIQLAGCGHRQCQSCLESQHGTTIKCPQCLTVTSQNQIHHCNLSNHYLSEQHLNSLMKIFHQMKLQLDNVRKASTQMNIDPSQSTTVVAADSSTVLFQELCEILDISSDDLNILNNDAQERLNNVLLQCQTFPTLTLNFLQSKLSIQESNNDSNGFTINHEIIKENLTSWKKTIENSQYISYDGTFIWKITNVKKQMVEAESGRQISIYSPPFYSSLNGYKMRARLYLNGDANARHTHMSLFFVLMRDLNDPILKFPFNYKVTFCLYDQTPAQRHIIDSFRPDIKSGSFQRPQSDMNIVSGIPKFFPLEVIQQEGNPYVRGDTMFIKLMVDFNDIPTTLLPYAMSLNPGLPIHVQQMMIEQEVKRRSEQQP